MRENNLLSPHPAAAVAAIPMTVRSSALTDGVRGSRWTTAGAGSSPPSSIGTPSVSAGMSEARRPLRRPFPWGLPGCMARPAGAARGLALRMDHGSQYLSDHAPTRSSSGASSRRLRRRAPDQRRRRAVQSHAEGTDHPWSHLPQHRSCGTPSATSSNSTMPSGSSKRTALPRSNCVARRSQSGPPRETNLCPRNRVRYTDGIFQEIRASLIVGFECRISHK